MKASVKVMNSYEFKNYEIVLEKEVGSLMEVNELRIDAQILVDYAIKQKKAYDRHQNDYNNLVHKRDNLQRDLIHFNDFHGKPKEKLGWIDDKDDSEEPTEFIDYSEQIQNAKNEMESVEFQIANWNTYDYKQADIEEQLKGLACESEDE